MLTAVIAFFSPCGFVLPRMHLQSTIKYLESEGIETVVAQVVRPGQPPAPLPMNIRCVNLTSQDTIFFKENLWNIAARRLTNSDKLLFVDSDVFFSPGGLREAISKKLDECDVCQPFEIATWLGRDGELTTTRLSACEALEGNVFPRAGTYHPGFAWAMRRSAFDSLGGWYDRQPCGGGDSAFAAAFCPPESTPAWVSQQLTTMSAPSFVEYRSNARSLGLKFSTLRGFRVCHRWHGDTSNRKYESRNSMAPELVNGEYPLEYRPDGLLRWRPGVDISALHTYFQNRREDG